MMTNRSYLTGALTGAVALLLSVSAFALPITNGSMTGVPTIGAPPPGWASVSVDGDTISPGGLSGWGTGIGASPDGGTFLALLNNGGGGSFDAVQQIINGFVVGDTYTIAFSVANIGLDFIGDYANEGLIRANIAGVDLDSASLAHTGFGNQQWFGFSADFVATAASLTLTLSAERAASGGYAGGLDGVTIDAARQPIPEPSVLSLLAIGGLMLRRRKR